MSPHAPRKIAYLASLALLSPLVLLFLCVTIANDVREILYWTSTLQHHTEQEVVWTCCRMLTETSTRHLLLISFLFLFNYLAPTFQLLQIYDISCKTWLISAGKWRFKKMQVRTVNSRMQLLTFWLFTHFVKIWRNLLKLTVTLKTEWTSSQLSHSWSTSPGMRAKMIDLVHLIVLNVVTFFFRKNTMCFVVQIPKSKKSVTWCLTCHSSHKQGGRRQDAEIFCKLVENTWTRFANSLYIISYIYCPELTSTAQLEDQCLELSVFTCTSLYRAENHLHFFDINIKTDALFLMPIPDRYFFFNTSLLGFACSFICFY